MSRTREELQEYGRSLLRTARSEDTRQMHGDIALHLYAMSRWTLASAIHPISTFKAVMLIGDQETINRNAEKALSLPKIPDKTSRLLGEINKELTLANGVSITRPALVVAANTVGIHQPIEYAALMAAAFATDGLDGWLARRRGESRWGGAVDLTADHLADAAMYIYLSGEGIVPSWVPALTIGRGIVTDVIRAGHMLIDSNVKSALSPNEHPLSGLVTSRPLRVGYASLKAAVALSAPIAPSASEVLSEVAAGICLIRGVPVVFNRENLNLVSAIKNTIQKSKK